MILAGILFWPNTSLLLQTNKFRSRIAGFPEQDFCIYETKKGRDIFSSYNFNAEQK